MINKTDVFFDEQKHIHVHVLICRVMCTYKIKMSQQNYFDANIKFKDNNY